ncbi:hypothetical protein [uncultured Dubosiella sp.]|uniref:hypothetical protein n=1 Tax=uncultured Dubosiella sp. TaxID=1937011 RepID=UPI0025A620CF|nr:hypothetical protein [uncultured Dubosiella sp.]
MKYEEKLNRMANHIASHPHDYQTSISFLKLRSKAIVQERKNRKLEDWKKVQKYKET